MFREVDFQGLMSLIEGGSTFLLDIYAKWCHPCKLLDKEIGLAVDAIKNVEVVRIDYDRNTQVIDYLEVGSLPYLVLFRNGKIVVKLKGFQKSTTIIEEIRKARI